MRRRPPGPRGHLVLRNLVALSGNPQEYLARCTRERVGTADEPLTDARRAEILADVDRLADSALRTLGVAYRPLDTAEPERALPVKVRPEREPYPLYGRSVVLLRTVRPEQASHEVTSTQAELLRKNTRAV